MKIPLANWNNSTAIYASTYVNILIRWRFESSTKEKNKEYRSTYINMRKHPIMQKKKNEVDIYIYIYIFIEEKQVARLKQYNS